MKTLIFAAGLGTRLKPLTDTMPKALVLLFGFQNYSVKNALPPFMALIGKEKNGVRALHLNI